MNGLINASIAVSVIAGVSAWASGTGWRGFIAVWLVALLAGVTLIGLFWILGLLP